MNNYFKTTVVSLLALNLFGVGWLICSRPSRGECRGIVDIALKEKETRVLAKYSPILNELEADVGLPRSAPTNIEEFIASFGRIVFKTAPRPVPKLDNPK